MNLEHLKQNKIITYLFIGTALVFALYALVTKYPGQVIFPLLKASLLILAMFIYGFFFVSLFKSFKEKIEFPTIFAVGLMVTMLFFYLVSLFSILVPGVIIVFYVIPLVLVFFILKKHQPVFRGAIQSFMQRSPLEYLPFLLPFIYASLPSCFYDSLVYHLGIPNLYLQHGGFVETPQFLFANTSIYYEISLIPVVFAGDMVPRLFHFLIGVIFLLAAADFAVETFGVKKRHILLLLLLCMPMSIFLLSTVKNDLVGAFFIFLGIRCLLKKQLGFSALFWGFAIGIKYTNALPMIIFLVIFFIKELSTQFSHSPLERGAPPGRGVFSLTAKKLVIFLLVVMAVVIPMLVKNYIFAKNPFFPFFSQHFSAEFWDASRYQLMKADVGKMFHSLLDAVKFPYTISFGQLGFGGMVGAQFLIFLPFLLVIRERLQKKWYLFLFAVLTLYIGGYFTGSLRFLYIVFLFFSFYLALVYESVSQKILKSLFFIVIGINLVTALAAQEQMYHSYQLFFGKLDIEKYKAFTFPAYPGIAYVNSRAEPGARVVLVGEARNYYLKRPYLVSSGIDYSILKKYLNQSKDAESFIAALRNDKIDYIIFDLGEFNRLQREYRRLDETEWKKMASYLRDLQSRIVFQQDDRIFVFKVTGDPIRSP
ncbi:MAG: hypothetical protein JSV88_04400 [Candidatus Aminicenantes bacterium]|nr:MAG: hypothetical protein JSV88_04400 [Candidatus Aminicenantes bacterium]